MNILVTGGLGYIGSHTVLELASKANAIHIIDNLSNTSSEVLNSIQVLLPSTTLIFHEGDIRDESFLASVFSHNIDTVVHFAALKAVGESMQKPLDYYSVNVSGTISLLQAMQKAKVYKFIFSSSACVYGDQVGVYTENSPLCPISVYGKTKVANEMIITDYSKAEPLFQGAILRYFNPVGAHSSGLIGEDPNGIPNNLVPFIQKVVTGQLPILKIFGNDYESPDGTAVRDYLHIVDLAKGHVAAFSHLKPGIEIYNLGTGKGTTVLELVKAYEKVTGKEIPYEITGRREGDVNTLLSVPDKANRELDWHAEKNIEDMCRDSWNFINKKFS